MFYWITILHRFSQHLLLYGVRKLLIIYPCLLNRFLLYFCQWNCIALPVLSYNTDHLYDQKKTEIIINFLSVKFIWDNQYFWILNIYRNYFRGILEREGTLSKLDVESPKQRQHWIVKVHCLRLIYFWNMCNTDMVFPYIVIIISENPQKKRNRPTQINSLARPVIKFHNFFLSINYDTRDYITSSHPMV